MWCLFDKVFFDWDSCQKIFNFSGLLFQSGFNQSFTVSKFTSLHDLLSISILTKNIAYKVFIYQTNFVSISLTKIASNFLFMKMQIFVMNAFVQFKNKGSIFSSPLLYFTMNRYIQLLCFLRAVASLSIMCSHWRTRRWLFVSSM